MLILKLHRPQHLPLFLFKKVKLSYHYRKNICLVCVSCITKNFFTVTSSASCVMHIIHGTNIITAIIITTISNNILISDISQSEIPHVFPAVSNTSAAPINQNADTIV